MQALGGLISGIDTNSLIQAILQQQRIPIERLQEQHTSEDIKISRLGEFMSNLETLKTTLQDSFDSIGEVLALNGSSQDEDLFTVSTTGDAAPGIYDVEIAGLAEYEKNRSAGFGAATSEVMAGTLSIGSGPSPDYVDIVIEVGDTLTDVADKINSSDAEVSANVISDGTSSYLQITAEESGFELGTDADQAIQIKESYAGVTGQELGLVQINQARNAEVQIDGLSIESRTNQISTALPGVTLTLKATGSTTFNVEKDIEGTKENLQAFVDAYNDVAELIEAELDIDGEQNRSRSLSGETSVRSLQADLAEAVSFEISGLEGAFSALSDVGISRDADGKLTIDTEELDDALGRDMVGVAKLFTASSGLVERLSSVADIYADGKESVFGVRKEALGDSQDRMDIRMERLEVRLEKNQKRLERQFLQMELAMVQLQQQSGALASLMIGTG